MKVKAKAGVDKNIKIAYNGGMLKRKKLMKLRRERAALQLVRTHESVNSIEQLIENCVRNTHRRRKQAKTHKDWRTEYAASLQNAGLLPVRPESMQGIGAKRSVFDSRWKRPYEDEMATRESVALAEAAEKSRRIAPIANKMGYQYIGNISKEDLKTLGRKV